MTCKRLLLVMNFSTSVSIYGILINAMLKFHVKKNHCHCDGPNLWKHLSLSIEFPLLEVYFPQQNVSSNFEAFVGFEYPLSTWILYSGMETHFTVFNSLRLRQNGRHSRDGIFKHIFLNENVWILIKISLTLVPKGPINNIPELVQIMAWRHPGAKPLSEPIMVDLPMHICVSRPQWVRL